MALSESVNSLIGSLPATSRQNFFDLNGSGGPEVDIVPLDFPGISPGDRNFTSTSSSTSSAALVTISGVGRPTVPQKPQGEGLEKSVLSAELANFYTEDIADLAEIGQI